MDTGAARRARRQAIKADLTEAYSDEEASPPEWVDLLASIRDVSAQLRHEVLDETHRFLDSDIRDALVRRERVSEKIRDRVTKLNGQIKRLNLIVPHSRFTRPAIDPDELLRPLFTSQRRKGVTT